MSTPTLQLEKKIRHARKASKSTKGIYPPAREIAMGFESIPLTTRARRHYTVEPVSQKGAFPTGFFLFGRILLGLSSSLSSVEPIFYFCGFSGGGCCEGVLLYEFASNVGWKVRSVLRTCCASTACFARDEPSSKRVAGVGLGPNPPKLRCSWRCTQPRAAKAKVSVAVVVKCRRYRAVPPSASV